jgi:hypothetical protein
LKIGEKMRKERGREEEREQGKEGGHQGGRRKIGREQTDKKRQIQPTADNLS